ncbi:MAG: hypothetical protein WBW08_11785 [Methyloceanibacter sp.]|jgi:hypothetical protein
MAYRQSLWATALFILIAQPAYAICPNDHNCLDNSYGVGSPYKAEGSYDSPYSNKPYSTDAPKIFSDEEDEEEDRDSLSRNPYDAYSTYNPYGEYGSPYSSDSINNPYGTGAVENYLVPDDPNLNLTPPVPGAAPDGASLSSPLAVPGAPSSH